jgi:hypothetical protein
MNYVLLCIVALAGCSSSSAGEGHQAAETAARKPATLSAGVEAVREGIAGLSASETRGSEVLGQAAELRQIIQWLPELAAETDLGRSDWEEIQSRSRRLTENLDRALPLLREGSSRRFAEAVASMKPEISELERLAALAQTAGNSNE